MMPMPLAAIRSAVVTPPSRLHFGLWSLASPAGRQFGGVGAMVERPGLALVIEPGQRLEARIAPSAKGLTPVELRLAH